MDEATFHIIISLVCLVILILLIKVLIKGVIKTFKRQPVVAILCVIFLFPVYVIWAIIEIFTSPIERD